MEILFYTNMDCDICCTKSRVSIYNDLALCNSCFNDKGKLIVKTTAMKQYLLSEGDLKKLKYATKYNRLFNVDMKLYIVDDVEKLALEKHESMENIEKKKQERKSIRDEKRNRETQVKKNRRDELDKHLKILGLDGVREDSKLCHEYIEFGDKSGYNIEDISRIMSEMKFFCEMTNYRNILKDLRNDYKCGIGKAYNENDEANVKDQAKDLALEEFVANNKKNYHKIVREVPRSLMGKAGQYLKLELAD